VLNLLYTTHIYSANALTGHAWIMIVPLVTAAFLLAYLHKYTWETWTGQKKFLHLLVGAATTALFMFIPLIFLTNVNLMILPGKWSEVTGFFSSLQIGNVFPRYFHFMAASLALCGLFLVKWLGRPSFPVAEKLPSFTHAELRRHFYRWTFFVSLAQFAFGPLLLLTLPAAGLTGGMLVLVLGGAVIAALTLFVIWREIRAPDSMIGHRYRLTVGLFSLVVLAMAQGRHLHREATLAPHRRLITERTADFTALEKTVQERLKAGLDAGGPRPPPGGRKLFLQTCAACHALDKPTVAPSLAEIYELYKDNPAGIVTWAKAPGKKRPQYGQMPPFAHLGDDTLSLIAAAMLQQAATRPPP
jgi:cytochrome c